MVDRAERMLDWDHMIHAIERATPLHPPGMRTGYHGLTYGFLVGELVQRVTGKRFSQLVHDLVAEPLGSTACTPARRGRARARREAHLVTARPLPAARERARPRQRPRAR
jgi:CubicO group peptidase (beta-lactamase class C family)